MYYMLYLWCPFKFERLPYVFNLNNLLSFGIDSIELKIKKI